MIITLHQYLFYILINVLIFHRFYRSDESASEQESSDEVDSDTEGLGMSFL